MTLEERYNTAPATSYVGIVRTQQEASVGGGKPGVNFMNGEGFSGKPPAPDSVQAEFTRNAENDFKYEGGGKVPGKYSLSRWLEKGINKGDAYMRDVAFTKLIKGDERNAANTEIHKYSPLTGKTFYETLPNGSFAKNRADPKSRGYAAPSPGGVNG